MDFSNFFSISITDILWVVGFFIILGHMRTVDDIHYNSKVIRNQAEKIEDLENHIKLLSNTLERIESKLGK
ncbi:hypothetical protein F4U02_13195 [Acinetobacter haemolyticus]|uniref:hypothetical protein n=1 Tax=Acinetobacter haemolyticus TaxID=29430 RepID=UPI0012986476|nr:hypothetical protein [Acinetobacter haemolyticus]MQZ31940.1 hypothetical protein [Acinetobacter haemolyticus]